MEPGQAQRPLMLPSWEGLYQEYPRSDTHIADDSTGTDQMTHVIFRHAFRRTGRDIGEYYEGLGANQLLCRTFVEERLLMMRPGQTQSWTETFMRDWVKQMWDRNPQLEPQDSVQSVCQQANTLLHQLAPWVDQWEAALGHGTLRSGDALADGPGPVLTWRTLYERDWQHHVEALRVSFRRLTGLHDDRLDRYAANAENVGAARAVVEAIRYLLKRAQS